MTYCAVKGCHNTTNKRKEKVKITFHKFPVDPIVAAQWIEKLRLNRKEEWWKPSNCTKICSVHFDEKDKFLTKSGLCKIRQGAVPTKGLHIHCLDDCHEHDARDPLQLEKPHVGTSSSESYIGTRSSILRQQLINSNEAEASNDPIFQEDDSEFESYFDTPREYALRRKLSKKISLQKKHTKKIRTLQTKIRRLITKNISLRNILMKIKSRGVPRSFVTCDKTVQCDLGSNEVVIM